MSQDANDEKWTERYHSAYIHERQDDHRDPFEMDKCRVVHSDLFRRLQGKTQIFGIKESDYHRNRLTHSLEVASIASSIVNNIIYRYKKNNRRQKKNLSYLPSMDLIYVIGLLHDIGHPPFGHAGEIALNYSMHDSGGFEGNGHGLRMLQEKKFNLTRRTFLGILKYPLSFKDLNNEFCGVKPQKNRLIDLDTWRPPKCYLDTEESFVEWILDPLSSNDKQEFKNIEEIEGSHSKTIHKSLDCSIMDLADEISYGVHDLEDAIYLNLINKNDLDEVLSENYLTRKSKSFLKKRLNDMFDPDSTKRKKVFGDLVHECIIHTEFVVFKEFESPYLKFNLALNKREKKWLKILKDLVFERVINSQEVRTIEYGATLVVMRLFEALYSNPEKLLDGNDRKKIKQARDENVRKRIVCDYIAGMTDEYAYKMHERLYGLNTRSIFDVI